MHRAINIKHRIVRRVDIAKAPLATFDTIDLGDEDVKPSCNDNKSNSPAGCSTDEQVLTAGSSSVFTRDGKVKSGTIGGNNSKKSLSQTGGEDRPGKEVDATKEKPRVEGENVAEKKLEATLVTAEPLRLESAKPGAPPLEDLSHIDDSVADVKTNNAEKENQKEPVVTGLNRQGTIGRVNIPIKKQDSDSSSSSGSINEATFTFHASRPSVGHLEYPEATSSGFGLGKEGQASLVPENIDPSQILSPSKRKAYERRIERLRVTTSPIARPRSHTPISVVTLDEYATISSPEPSPAPLTVIPDKLKITLPCDEFSLKAKTPKLQSAKRKDSDENCFEFTEEILFSRTKSALVVNEDGQLPISPRRVLIPPTLTPATSPKLSTGPRLSAANSPYEEQASSQLLYIQPTEPTAYNFFGETVDETEEENWASFPDTALSSDKEETCSVLPSEGSISICLTGKVEASFPVSFSDKSELDPLDADSVEASVLEAPKFTVLDGDSTSTRSLAESSGFYDIDDGENKLRINGHGVTASEDTVEESLVDSHLVVPESEEILTIEVKKSNSGCEKHIDIEIKPSPALPFVDTQHSRGIQGIRDDIQTANVTCADIHTANVTCPTVVSFTPDIPPSPCDPQLSSGTALPESAILVQSSSSIPTADPHGFSELPPAPLTSPPQTNLVQGSCHFTDPPPQGPCLIPDGQDFLSGTPSDSSANQTQQALVVNVEFLNSQDKSSEHSLPVLPSVDENLCGFNSLHPSPSIEITFENQPGTEIAHRPPSTNPFDEDFSFTEIERPASTNPFDEELQNLVSDRPSSTNPFEDQLQNFAGPRPPSTNPFDLAESPCAANPFDQGLGPADPFNFGLQPAATVVNPFLENSSPRADLMDFVSSYDSSSA
ncbi:uncharacterized protein LOC131945938 [Physella acuta]|uniref:uncharacterized protein LOC131945938 n=1 Tax=Physella acuta TaxID=109671 RepID=UPI0027DDA66E|nr:uncharacterized protein LOC131945938 [Physella acuta]